MCINNETKTLSALTKMTVVFLENDYKTKNNYSPARKSIGAAICGLLSTIVIEKVSRSQDHHRAIIYQLSSTKTLL